jgi:hypothetical protein
VYKFQIGALMAKNMENKCREWLDEYEGFWTKGVLYSAFYYLGEIHHALPMLPDAGRLRWAAILNEKRPSHSVVELIRAEAEGTISSLEGMLSSHEPLMSEESLLLAGCRYHVFLLQRLFDDVYHLNFRPVSTEVDDRIRRSCSRTKMAPAARRMYHKLYSS